GGLPRSHAQSDGSTSRADTTRFRERVAYASKALSVAGAGVRAATCTASVTSSNSEGRLMTAGIEPIPQQPPDPATPRGAPFLRRGVLIAMAVGVAAASFLAFGLPKMMGVESAFIHSVYWVLWVACGLLVMALFEEFQQRTRPLDLGRDLKVSVFVAFAA